MWPRLLCRFCRPAKAPSPNPDTGYPAFVGLITDRFVNPGACIT
jgi:hypothetical protein